MSSTRSVQMRPIPTNVSPFRGLCVCLCAGHSLKLCNNLCTDRDSVWSRFAWAKEHVTGVMGARTGATLRIRWTDLCDGGDTAQSVLMVLKQAYRNLKSVYKLWTAKRKTFSRALKYLVNFLSTWFPISYRGGTTRRSADISCCAAVRKIIFGKDCNRRVTVKFSQGHWYW